MDMTLVFSSTVRFRFDVDVRPVCGVRVWSAGDDVVVFCCLEDVVLVVPILSEKLSQTQY